MGYLDENGLAELTKKIKAYTDKDVIRYGFRRTKAESDPEDRITYLFDAVGMTPAHMDYGNDTFEAGGWGDFIDLVARPVMQKLDGSVDYELSHTNQNYKKDGVTASDVANTSYAGNAMVEFTTAFPWVKRYEDATYEYVIFSNKKLGLEYKAYAHGAGEDDINVPGSFFFGMFDGSNVSSVLKSFGTGSPMVNQTAETEITYAKANGTGFNIFNKAQWDYILDLCVLISKSDDLQTSFGKGRVSASSALANGTMLDKGAFWGDTGGTNGVKVLYIENPWGNIWQRMHGAILDAGNGYKFKMTPPFCDTPISAADYSDYHAMGQTVPSSNNYVVNNYNSEYGFCPISVSGGGSDKYFCDYFYQNQSQVDFAIVGGTWINGLACGRYLYLNYLASDTYTSIGARLSYTPAG